MSSRREFSRKTRREAWERAGERCEGMLLLPEMRNGFRCVTRCNAPLDHGCFHYDHIDPTWISGRNDLDNCQLLCVQCHKEKTVKDQGNIAKSKRIQDKRIKAKVSRNPMAGSRSSKWKKKMDGSVVLR